MDEVNTPAKVVISISADDTAEVTSIKENIEFSVNSARDAISALSYMLKQTANPRFAEAMATLLNVIATSNTHLLKINQDKLTLRKDSDRDPPARPGLLRNPALTKIENTVVISTAEVLKDVSTPESITLINGKRLD